MHIQCSIFIMRTYTSNMQRVSLKTWQYQKKNKQHPRAYHSNTENLNEFYFASMRIRFMCVLWVLAYITICNQTMSSIRMDLCHFQILRESLKRMRINFLCDTRVWYWYDIACTISIWTGSHHFKSQWFCLIYMYKHLTTLCEVVPFVNKM